MKHTPKNRCKILTRPHNLEKPDPKNGPLLAINTILAGLCETIEADTREGKRNFAAETWAELASDLIHSLPSRKVVCIQEGNEIPLFANAKAAFERSLNKLPNKSEIRKVLEQMAMTARVATGNNHCDQGHAKLGHLLHKIGMIEAAEMKAFEKEFCKHSEEKSVDTNRPNHPAPNRGQPSTNAVEVEKNEMALTLKIEGVVHTFPLLKVGKTVAVLQLNSQTETSVAALAQIIRDLIRRDLGKDVRIAQVFQHNSSPEAISEIYGELGSKPQWKPWEGEIEGLQEWVKNQ